KDTATPVRAAALSFVVNIVLSVLLMRWFSTTGLAMASNIAVLVQAWFLQSRLTRKLAGLGFAPLLPNLGKILVASTIMGLVIWGGLQLVALAPLTGKIRDLVVVAGFIPAAAAIYGVLLWVLKIEGREEMEVLLRKLRARFGSGAT